jgi:hypothetical protein
MSTGVQPQGQGMEPGFLQGNMWTAAFLKTHAPGGLALPLVPAPLSRARTCSRDRPRHTNTNRA